MIQISNKVKILIFLLCIVVLISTVNTTYSRYASAAAGTVTTNFARWQIFVNNENITANYDTSMSFTPVILPNENVAANKIAPSSKGYFDVIINPSNVDVSFTYDININIPEDSLITDIKVTDYAIVEGTEITESTIFDKIKLSSSNLSDTLLYDNSKENFSFKPFIVRMYFSWIDGDGESMSDTDDSNIGNMITNGEDTKFELGINISFKQYIGDEETESIDNENEPIDNDVNQEEGDEVGESNPESENGNETDLELNDGNITE